MIKERKSEWRKSERVSESVLDFFISLFHSFALSPLDAFEPVNGFVKSSEAKQG